MNDEDHLDDGVGSLAEEATKLFGLLSDWARDHASDLGDGVTGLAAQTAAAAGEVNEHLATDAAECSYCPICRGVHAVRHLSPEVKAHLSVAAAALVQAAAVVLSTEHPVGQSPRSDRAESVDLDDRDWPEDKG